MASGTREPAPNLTNADTPAATVSIPANVRARVNANLAAIRTVARLEENQAEPSEQDRQTLAGWTSWGAVPQIFDLDDARFAAERDQLRELLDEREWVAARRTILNAHYTATDYTRPMWATLAALGFEGGSVLEPGCGSGQFLTPPASAFSSPVRTVGVELDPMTARIAQLLHPQAQVRAESFADSPFADDTFDAVIGNVPFGQTRLHDPQHNAGKHSLHNHFLIKSLDLTHPGGLVVALTSRYTLDAQNTAARQDMSDRADLVGAIRLPSGAHRDLAGTEAVTDLLVLRRREPGLPPADESWVHTTTHELPDRDGDLTAVTMNAWWEEHPEMILGEIVLGHGQYGREDLTVRACEDQPLSDQLASALQQIVAQGRERGLTWQPRAAGETVPDPDAVIQPVARSGDITAFEGHLSYDATSGEFTRVHGNVQEPFAVPASAQRPLRELIGLRDTAVALLDAEASTLTDTPDMASLRLELNRRYDAYTDRFGPINAVTVSQSSRLDKNGDPITTRRYPTPMRLFRNDPHHSVVGALEHFNEKTGVASKTAIMSGRVVAARTIPTHADTPGDALAIVWDQSRTVDLDRIADLLQISPDAARTALGDLVYDEPETGTLIPAAEYLSGDVRAKLRAAQDDPRFTVNVNALEKVLPRDLGPDEITVRLGAIWVPRQDTEAFLREMLDDPRVNLAHGGGSMWKITAGSKVSQQAVTQWGTERLNALDLAERLMTQRRIVVEDTIREGDTERRVVNPPETEAAQAKAEAMQEAFNTWVWAEPARSARLARVYNDTFNAHVLRDYTADGQRLALPGLVSAFNPHPHQRSAVARIISEPSVGLYHGVGAGKTAEMVMGAMELGRLGLVNKPAVVVPNHMLEQVTREWLGLYPTANVLAAGSEDLRGEGRRDFIAKAATGAWDGIVMTQGAFGSLDVSRMTRQTYIDTVVRGYEQQLGRLKTTGERNLTTKRMEKLLADLEQRLAKKLDMKKDPGLTFEQTGIDYLLVDELHMYKNRTLVSNIQDVASEGSLRATDLDMKLMFLRDRARESGRRERVLTGATATPISNSMAEAYVMQTYLRPDLLEEAGLTDFDSWAATFGESVSELEMAPEGGFRAKTRFARFNNLPELLRMWHVSADVKTSAELQLDVPLIKARADGKRAPEAVIIEPSSELLDFMSQVGERAEAIKTRMVNPRVDNMLKLSSHGRWAGMDLRLLPEDIRPGRGDPGLFDEPTKIKVAAEKIHAIWRENKDRTYRDTQGQPHPRPGALQIVFCDIGTPGEKWNIYDTLREELVARGMERSRIQFVHDANTDAKKDRLFNECRSGGVDVIIGSTGKMGVGTNIQTRAIALHHLDCPWRPADLEQRDGRIIRQGNQNREVEILRYATERSFDTYMWQTVERKAKFIEQVMHGTLEDRSAEEVSDRESFSMSEMKAISSGNPKLLEKAQADQDLARLENLNLAHQRNQTALRSTISATQATITSYEQRVPALKRALGARISTAGQAFRLRAGGRVFTERVEAADALRPVLMQAATQARGRGEAVTITDFAQLGGHRFDAVIEHTLGSTRARLELQDAPADVFVREDLAHLAGVPGSFGLVSRMENALTNMDRAHEQAMTRLENARRDLDVAQHNLGQPFARTDDLLQARENVARLERELTGTPEPEEQSEPHDSVAQRHDAILTQLEVAHEHDAILTRLEQKAAQRSPQVIAAEGATRARKAVAQARERRDETPGHTHAPAGLALTADQSRG